MTRRVVLRFLAGTLGVVLLVTMLSAWASATCGDTNHFAANLHRQSWQGSDPLQPGSLLVIVEDTDPIVGMWHVTFTAQGNTGGPPDGKTIGKRFATRDSGR